MEHMSFICVAEKFYANKPYMYHRCVDDTLVTFNSEKECDDFFIFLTRFTPLYGLLLRKNVMVLFPFWMFWLRKVKLNLLLRFTGSRH